MKPISNFAAGALGFCALIASPALADDLTLGAQLEPPALDPTAGAAAAIDEVVFGKVFEGLVRFGQDGSIQPALAESWEITDFGLVYTFKLRESVKFHDGTDFDAEDVKFSLERILAEDSTNAQKALYTSILNVEAVDPLTVRITLSEPTGAFLFNLAWGDAVIVAPETIADAANTPVGTGPFTFSKWTRGDNVELVKNEAYWGEPAKLDKVTFKFISDPNAAFAAVMAGDIDAFPRFPAPEILDQLKSDPRFEIVTGSTEGEVILGMNNKSEALSDVRVRAAIAHAIDRQALIDGAMFGYGVPIGTHFSPENPSYVDLTLQSRYDPELSKQLLAEAGASDLKLRMKLPPPSYARRGGEIIAAQLREVGIEVQTTNVEWAAWLEEVFKTTDYDLSIVAHVEPMDIGIYGRDEYYFNYDSQEFKTVLGMLNRAVDGTERTALLRSLQRIIADDYVNGFLFQLPRLSVQNAKLKGLWSNSQGQATEVSGAYWEK